MDDLAVLIIEQWGIMAVVGFIALYLAIEFGLDLGRDLLIDWIKDKREDRGETEWGNEPHGE